MDWIEENNFLKKDFEFKNFVEAVDFVNKIMPLAEKADHHPDILIYSYKKVRITLTTHEEGKVTQKDYSLANAIDASLS